MPKVPEYNLPKFNPPPQTQNERVDSLYWRYKKSTPPKDTYKPKKRTKLKDKQLISEHISHLRHIRSIRDET